ncbi:MAG: hypothetical protein IJS39_16800, partial [Synergistaceae bacterium]|nr:hypothetical protein [Synergistaceae bacterium]
LYAYLSSSVKGLLNENTACKTSLLRGNFWMRDIIHVGFVRKIVISAQNRVFCGDTASREWAQGHALTTGVLSLSAKLPSLPISQSYVLVSGVIAL